MAKHRLVNKRIGIVANRVRIKTKSYLAMEQLARTFNIPLIATLRDTQNYSIAMESGLGICEMQRSLTAKDDNQWQPLLEWLHDKIPHKQVVVQETQQADNLNQQDRDNWRTPGMQSVLPFNR